MASGRAGARMVCARQHFGTWQQHAGMCVKGAAATCLSAWWRRLLLTLRSPVGAGVGAYVHACHH
jgi:hypothetical protein